MSTNIYTYQDTYTLKYTNNIGFISIIFANDVTYPIVKYIQRQKGRAYSITLTTKPTTISPSLSTDNNSNSVCHISFWNECEMDFIHRIRVKERFCEIKRKSFDKISFGLICRRSPKAECMLSHILVWHLKWFILNIAYIRSWPYFISHIGLCMNVSVSMYWFILCCFFFHALTTYWCWFGDGFPPVRFAWITCLHEIR